jgi:hypothetical protein
VQEVEERSVAELEPQALRVKGRERNEELAEGGALAGEEVGETIRERACVFHEAIFSRGFRASGDARIRPEPRERGRGSATPRARGERAGAAAPRVASDVFARSLRLDAPHAQISSSAKCT